MNRRLGHGLQFRGVYAFSKPFDDGDNMNTGVATSSPAFFGESVAAKVRLFRASFDVRYAAVMHATYDLSLGRSDSSQPHRWVKRLFGNWQLRGIQTVQSGLPFTRQLS